MSAAVVLLAAGSGTRVGAGVNKVLLPVAGAPVLVHALRSALAVGEVDHLVVVVRPGDEAEVADAVAPVLLEHPDHADREVRVTVGGATRHASERAALRALEAEVDDGSIDVVALHDAARPLAAPVLYDAVLAAAREHGGAVPAYPVTGLVRRDGGPVPGAGRGSRTVAVQTPQAFRADVLLAAHRWAEETGFTGTDTASCVAAWAGRPGHGGPDVEVVAVPSDATNLKVTWPGDVRVAEHLIRP
ncbi:2-C-methyl-D-erythritol 4-phosphate cytidylyltransferase [Nocardioides sp. ChNu-153]|uniref:IspD/TarI family cytidylyltransferase n=1 Tax=unclassified Nocardioides TaxID=2615069 RepID=UPI002404EFE8|nr:MULTISPECIES: IspD/TarI family cytidylyltransferase [unclassified Nocardioides]MDF9716854.1 2-C-methyl-D-erythritol 4-phosphate cytidylyltransferase [Nocardioides sp. ChNu-99]MDN7120240.1 2-C-methyl-D-erythritol 4-phosphate cytidylyltransferase [Nocardioides sp. ChNu-153]